MKVKFKKAKNLIIIFTLIYLLIDIHYFLFLKNYYDDVNILSEAANEEEKIFYFRWVLLSVLLFIELMEPKIYVVIFFRILFFTCVCFLFYEVRLTMITRGSVVYSVCLMELIALVGLASTFFQGVTLSRNRDGKSKADVLDA